MSADWVTGVPRDEKRTPEKPWEPWGLGLVHDATVARGVSSSNWVMQCFKDGEAPSSIRWDRGSVESGSSYRTAVPPPSGQEDDMPTPPSQRRRTSVDSSSYNNEAIATPPSPSVCNPPKFLKGESIFSQDSRLLSCSSISDSSRIDGRSVGSVVLKIIGNILGVRTKARFDALDASRALQTGSADSLLPPHMIGSPAHSANNRKRNASKSKLAKCEIYCLIM